MTKAEKLKQGLKEFFTRNLIIIILVRCGITITDQMINGVQGRIGDGIGVPAALIGALTSVLMIVRIVTRAPAGSFTDNGSKRNVLIFGCLVKAIAMLCYGFAGNTVMFAIAPCPAGLQWRISRCSGSRHLWYYTEKRNHGLRFRDLQRNGNALQ